MAFETPSQPIAGAVVSVADFGTKVRNSLIYLYDYGMGEKRKELPIMAAQAILGTALPSAAVELVQSATGTATINPQWYQARYDGATNEGRMWNFVLPSNYAGSAYVKIGYNTGTASVAGSSVIWGVQVAALSNTDLWNGKAFGVDNRGTSTVAGTSLVMNDATVSLTNVDSMVALDNICLLVYRAATADTFNQDAVVTKVELYYS
jgi:hypothetical protein